MTGLVLGGIIALVPNAFFPVELVLASSILLASPALLAPDVRAADDRVARFH
jgi:hypothetical protein